MRMCPVESEICYMVGMAELTHLQALAIVACALAYLFLVWFLGGIPGRIARRRHLVHAKAVAILGWFGALTLGILWTVALIWAYNGCRRVRTRRRDPAPCPYCAQSIRKGELVCHFCNRQLEELTPLSALNTSGPPTRYCVSGLLVDGRKVSVNVSASSPDDARIRASRRLAEVRRVKAIGG